MLEACEQKGSHTRGSWHRSNAGFSPHPMPVALPDEIDDLTGGQAHSSSSNIGYSAAESWRPGQAGRTCSRQRPESELHTTTVPTTFPP
jgi:hypothetical protein